MKNKKRKKTRRVYRSKSGRFIACRAIARRTSARRKIARRTSVRKKHLSRRSRHVKTRPRSKSPKVKKVSGRIHRRKQGLLKAFVGELRRFAENLRRTRVELLEFGKRRTALGTSFQEFEKDLTRRTPGLGWITVSQWKARLLKDYPTLNFSRSDVPYSGFDFYFVPKKFLSIRRDYPPKPRDVYYIILETWRIVLKEEEDEHYLWCQRKALAEGKSFTWILKNLPDIVFKQNENLEIAQSDGKSVQVKEFAGFSVFPTDEWEKVRLGKLRRRLPARRRPVRRTSSGGTKK